MKYLFVLISILFQCERAFAQTQFRVSARFRTREAVQGVAVDKDHFYTINTRGIGKYDKTTGKFINEVKIPLGQVIHLDGGIVIKNKLFCAHSNYPGIPMMSSIEIFSTRDLKHTGSHSFGTKYGSCTWADFFNNSWWVCFAHYDQFRSATGKGTESTILVRFDRKWNEESSWIFPENVISDVRPMSISGGSWGPDGKLYITGHDSSKVYVLQLPQTGSVLEYSGTARIESCGQGIAWDRTGQNNLYGIIRKENAVIVSVLSNQE